MLTCFLTNFQLGDLKPAQLRVRRRILIATWRCPGVSII